MVIPTRQSYGVGDGGCGDPDVVFRQWRSVGAKFILESSVPTGNRDIARKHYPAADELVDCTAIRRRPARLGGAKIQLTYDDCG